jgi:hypothetical protein
MNGIVIDTNEFITAGSTVEVQPAHSRSRPGGRLTHQAWDTCSAGAPYPAGSKSCMGGGDVAREA